MQHLIDPSTIDTWSAPYRGWHYWPDHVISNQPNVPGFERFENTDAPTVYQVPDEPQKWYMSFIGFDGNGYNSFVAESSDLVHWTNPRLAAGFGREGEFDYGGRVVGAYLYESYGIGDPRILKRSDGKYWTLYGAYPFQGGYELEPGYNAIASSEDGLSWERAQEASIVAVSDDDATEWESICIYQPWLVENDGRYYNFYNAKGDVEQSGLALSGDLFTWRRRLDNPIVRVTPGGYDEQFASDPKVYRDGDHWTMFYFGLGRGGAHIMIAFSRDLIHWTTDPDPLYKAGGNPSGLDAQYAHKTSLVYNPATGAFYLYYCAVGNRGRGIGLITSRPLG